MLNRDCRSLGRLPDPYTPQQRKSRMLQNGGSSTASVDDSVAGQSARQLFGPAWMMNESRTLTSLCYVLQTDMDDTVNGHEW